MKTLIGVSGKMGAGKDLVGEIIQYLTDDYALKDGLTFYENEEIKGRGMDSFQFHASDFEIKKFADILKDIVCMLINCTREQLEDREFKEKELGEEWQISQEYMESGIGVFEQINWVNRLKNPLTPRLLMQLLGTDAGRKILHPNIWVNALFSKFTPLNPELAQSMGNVLDYTKCTFPSWVITDVRFPNEVESIQSRGGIVIRINRGKQITKPQHLSETALDDYGNFDYVIDNNGTIETLINKIRTVLYDDTNNGILRGF
jgi:hypothetical protein